MTDDEFVKFMHSVTFISTPTRINTVDKLINEINNFAKLNRTEQLYILLGSERKFRIGDIVWTPVNLTPQEMIIQDIYESPCQTIWCNCSFKEFPENSYKSVSEHNLFKTRNEAIDAQISYLEQLREKEA
jgi:hypothetical protein